MAKRVTAGCLGASANPGRLEVSGWNRAGVLSAGCYGILPRLPGAVGNMISSQSYKDPLQQRRDDPVALLISALRSRRNKPGKPAQWLVAAARRYTVSWRYVARARPAEVAFSCSTRRARPGDEPSHLLTGRMKVRAGCRAATGDASDKIVAPGDITIVLVRRNQPIGGQCSRRTSSIRRCLRTRAQISARRASPTRSFTATRTAPGWRRRSTSALAGQRPPHRAGDRLVGARHDLNRTPPVGDRTPVRKAKAPVTIRQPIGDVVRTCLDPVDHDEYRQRGGLRWGIERDGSEACFDARSLQRPPDAVTGGRDRGQRRAGAG